MSQWGHFLTLLLSPSCLYMTSAYSASGKSRSPCRRIINKMVIACGYDFVSYQNSKPDRNFINTLSSPCGNQCRYNVL